MSRKPVLYRWSSKVLKELPLSDQAYAIETVTTLVNAIAPDAPWDEDLFPEAGCFVTDGMIIGYQTSFTLDLRAEAFGYDIDDVQIIEASRTWLTERDYEFVRDIQHSNGTREIRAIKESETDGIGISIKGHPGIVGI
ncbi:MAG: hypothetical protein AAFO01_23280, partial [Pseudomonadota bacterium]